MGLEKADIRREWDWVRKGLYAIWDKTPAARKAFQSRPEDVYAAVAAGGAELWVDRGSLSWAILSHRAVGFGNTGRVLTVWYAASASGGRVGGACRAFLKDIEDLARLGGFIGIEFYTPFPGVARLAQRLGFVEQAVNYAKEVRP